MSIQKKIKKISLAVLGCEAEPWDNVWDRVKDLAEAFGAPRVEEVFEEWAQTRRGDIVRKPVEEFLRVAPGLIQGITSLKPNQKLMDLINNLVFISNGEISFDREQQAELGRLLGEWTETEIQSAFQEFYRTVQNDEFLIKHAARNFVEKAPQFLALQKRRREQAEKQQTLIARISENERATVEAELAESDRKRREEEELANSESTLD